MSKRSRVSSTARSDFSILEKNQGYIESLKIAYKLYESLNTARALSCYILLRNNEIEQLISLECSPGNYLHWRDYYKDALATNFLRKFRFRAKYHPGFVTRTKENATRAFLEAESRCRETNDKIFGNRLSGDASSILYRAREKISRVLFSFSCDEWIESCRFGPGADLVNLVRRSTVYDKMTGRLVATPAFQSLALALVKSHPAWATLNQSVEPVWHNRVTFVPKDAKTDRSIAIEPGLNAFAQAGLGRMIRRRLALFGNSIKYQHVNQRYAELGSVDDTISTIDLSSASDTLSYALVVDLIPQPWFHALDLTRSPFGLGKFGSVCYEKFSSMGNGYTFELESLIFWALAQSCCDFYSIRGPVRVYGDDIVVPSLAYEPFCRLLDEVGFIPNRKKSFHSGPFRESCGMDYFDGKKVRSLYLKEALSNVPSIFKLANGISRAAHFLLGGNQGRDACLEECWKQVVRLLPKEFRTMFGPFSFDTNGMGIPSVPDQYLCADWDVAKPRRTDSVRYREGWQGWSVRCLRARSKKFSFNERDGDLAVAMYLSRNGSEVDSEGFLSLRGRTRYSTRRETVFEWQDLGPWV